MRIGFCGEKIFKLLFFSIPPWEWYLGEIKTCQFWFSHSNPLPMGSSWAKKIFVKSLYGWDMAPCSYFRLKSALKWKIECQAAIFTVCNPDQSSYTISWTHIRCFWGTNKIFDFFRFSLINHDLSKNPCFLKIVKNGSFLHSIFLISKAEPNLLYLNQLLLAVRFGEISTSASKS